MKLRDAYAYTGGRPFVPDVPCVVLVHGALHDHSVFGLHARAFAHAGRPVLAVDLPGHGRSGGPALGSVEALADWLVALLEEAGAGPAALVGHSMGSLVALEAASRLGQRAARLALVATAAPMKVTPALLQTAAGDPLAAIDLVNALSFSTLASKPAAPGPGTWVQGANRALMRRMQAGGIEGGNLFLTDFGVCDAYAGGLEAAARLRCPALVVSGTRDQMTPPRAAAALAAAARATSTRLPCGHAVMQESPEALQRLLADFIGP